MRPSHAAAVLALGLLTACGPTEDPRLPGGLYEEARQLNVSNKGPEAKALMQDLIARYPDSEPAMQARKDLFFINAMIERDIADRQKATRLAIRRVMDALTRYREQKGEYPESLQDLVPEYLEQVPMAAWGHPFLYRGFVSRPIEDLPVKRGPARQRFNTKLDSYYLCCLGCDAAPGGDNLATDILVSNGTILSDKFFDPIPRPQPLR